MRTGLRGALLLTGILPALCLRAEAQQGRPPEDECNVLAGKALYALRCAACHGMEGDGAGPAAPYMFPQPRDFTDIVYKLRSTLSGERPQEIDLFRTISQGIPGTSMTSWQEILSVEERWQVLYYIKTFAAEDWEWELPEEAIVQLPDSGTVPDEMALARGKKLYEILKCSECHGDRGKGNGPSSKTVQDEFDNPMWPADLTRPDLFRGGSEVRDIARAFITGLGTTPMPSYVDYFTLFSQKEDLPEDQKILHVPVDDNALALAHYVLSLGAGDKPRKVQQQLLADYIDGEIPDDPDSPVWDETEGAILQLSAQLTLPPRWQFANVDRLLIDALYNDKELGILVQWDDRTEDRKHGRDDYEIEAGRESIVLPTRADLAALRKKSFADAVSIQFPIEFMPGTRRPFFALGAPETPVESWRFRADRGGEKFTAKGFCTEPEDMEKIFTNARYDDGRWKVVFKIPIEEDARFTPGRYLPIAFAAWDGANGESGTRCAISSWYWLLLKPQRRTAPYLYGLLAFVATVIGEFLVIKKLRENSRDRTTVPVTQRATDGGLAT